MCNFPEACAALQSGKSQLALLLTEWPEENVTTFIIDIDIVTNNHRSSANTSASWTQIGLGHLSPQCLLPALLRRAVARPASTRLLGASRPDPHGPAWGRRPAGPARWASGAPRRCEAGSPRPPHPKIVASAPRFLSSHLRVGAARQHLPGRSGAEPGTEKE